MKKLILVSILFVLAGCGTTSGRIGEMPLITDKASAADVLVVRISTFVGAGNGYTIALDGKDLFGIGSGEHARFQVPQGQHYIAVKCFGGMSPTWKEDSLKFDAGTVAPSIFLVSPAGSCAEIKKSTQDEVKEHLEKSKLLDLEKSVR